MIFLKKFFLHNLFPEMALRAFEGEKKLFSLQLLQISLNHC